jgi:hypothetical protein
VISPLRSNLYLNEVDRMLERAKTVTRCKYTAVEYARFADDLVILVDAHPRQAWLVTAYRNAFGRNWPDSKSRSMKRRLASSTSPRGSALDSWGLISAASAV